MAGGGGGGGSQQEKGCHSPKLYEHCNSFIYVPVKIKDNFWRNANLNLLKVTNLGLRPLNGVFQHILIARYLLVSGMGEGDRAEEKGTV